MVLVYLGVHAGAVAAFWTPMLAADLIIALVLLQLRGFCISGGYHRGLAHHSYRTTRVFRWLLAAGGCTSLRGGPLWWVALHRHHHRHSDTDNDTFTPRRDGFWWSYAGWLLSGRYNTTDYRRVPDLARRPELVWLNRYWLLPPALLALGVFLWRGWEGFLVGFCLSSALLFHSMAAIDSFNHWFGRRRYDTGDGSRNNFVLSLLTMGEGWHNNHHHYQSSANSGFFWFEVDGTWTLLRLLSLFRLVWDLRTPPDSVLQSNLLRQKHAKEAQALAVK
jgi:stearoyl-CoA desaturase (delta-9 desaturase)